MNVDDAISAIVREGPQDIRVMCSDGHFIADMTLSVKNGAIAMQGAPSGNKLRRNASQGKPVVSAAVHAAPNWNTVLECVNSKCTFSGYYNSQNLALELVRARMAGHAEYRLTR